MEKYELSEREKAILRYVIHQFILTASPVGSRNIAKKYNIGLSPATIRNIMSDLEDSGYLGHPHTSAGRMPTDKGYRFYVDSLMDPPELNIEEINIIENSIDSSFKDTNEILRVTSLILSDLTKQLACVSYPNFDDAILSKLQLVQLSTTRILVVLSIKSGLVKTITLEFDAELVPERIDSVQNLLNEKLAGLKFSEIRKTFKERIKDQILEETRPIIRVFLDSAEDIFTDIKNSDKSIITGAKNILRQPEFEDHEQFQSIIELIEDQDIILHIMDKKNPIDENEVLISIGHENLDKKLSDFSLVTKKYKIGQATGTLGIVGPKRMEYSKAIAAVIYVAEQLSKELTKPKF